MPIGRKFGTNAVSQIWTITYFTSVLKPKRLLAVTNVTQRFVLQALF